MDDLMPLEERAHQGNPEIVAWCYECRENTVPHRGTCLWCLIPIGARAYRPPEQLEFGG